MGIVSLVLLTGFLILNTSELKKRYFAADDDWNIESGDILNKEYLEKL